MAIKIRTFCTAYLDLLSTNDHFTCFQDTQLKQLVEEYQERWDIISEHFPDRSDVQCQQRWTKVVNPELVKGPWTKEVSKEFFYR